MLAEIEDVINVVANSQIDFPKKIYILAKEVFAFSQAVTITKSNQQIFFKQETVQSGYLFYSSKIMEAFESIIIYS